ncbi:uncharacterized protein LOC27206674 [Drosophila simulans]|uniref:uncharacterized protein LOC27206674 n=1 Tax=Drosophila simulans TaxID=7240 RepID=UPI00078AE00B|nr:uncharacterized protein LOC27206674 [Drosophila simulans]KMZ01812.1 uncharacterized protein Dsimw501_GD26822 [Drosophila simulans]
MALAALLASDSIPILEVYWVRRTFYGHAVLFVGGVGIPHCDDFPHNTRHNGPHIIESYLMASSASTAWDPLVKSSAQQSELPAVEIGYSFVPTGGSQMHLLTTEA